MKNSATVQLLIFEISIIASMNDGINKFNFGQTHLESSESIQNHLTSGMGWSDYHQCWMALIVEL